MPSVTSSGVLLERREELTVLDRAVEAARAGSGRSVVIEGDAGIGKTSLVDAARRLGHDRGVRVLQARGTALERPYAFGTALALLWPLVRDRSVPEDVLWSGAAGRARSLFDAGSPPPRDHFALIHGLTWVAMNATEHAPLLLIVDDAQWADDPSMRWLHRLVHRVAELPLSIVTAFRTGEPPGEVRAADLARAPGAVLLSPAPLSVGAVGAMLEDEAELAGADPGTVAEVIHAATGGNPFFVTELLRHGGEDVEGHGAQVTVPPTIERFVAERIERLDPAARQVGEAIAVLDDGATLGRVLALTGLGVRDVEAAVRRLLDAGVLHASGALTFLHPIVRSAVYDSVPLVARGRLHRDAALLLHEEGAAIGMVATQLLASAPQGDARVVSLLRAAAAETMQRGEPTLAARMLVRALAEPPPAEDRLAIMQELARAEAIASPAQAAERYRAVLALVDHPPDRVRMHLELGHALIGASAWSDAVAAFEAGLRELDADPSIDDLERQDLRDRLEAGFVSAAWVSIERHADAEAVVERILDEARLASVRRDLAVWIAFQRGTVVSTTAADALALVDRAVADTPMDALIGIGQLVEVAAGLMVTTDALPQEVAFLDDAIAAAERAGSVGKVGMYTYCRGWPQLYMGRLTEAIADAEASLRVGQLGAETFQPAASALLAFAHLERGDIKSAAAAVDLDERWGERVDFKLLVPVAHARVALARGDNEAGLRWLDEAGHFLAMLGFRAPVPPDVRIWRSTTLLRLGRRDEARDVAEEALEIARAWGADWPLAVALRTTGLAIGGREGLPHLEEAAAILERSPARLEAVRTQVELGAAVRRLGRSGAARDILARAADEAHALGTTALLERARSELVAAGARPRRMALVGVDSLTPAERRVADLAAAGATNRQIAEALFVTPKAVEFHLSNAYPKLGITSRRDLQAALDGQGPG